MSGIIFGQELIPELIDDLTLAILDGRDSVGGKSAVGVAVVADCGVAVVTGDISIISAPASSNSGSGIGRGRDIEGRYRWRDDGVRLGEGPSAEGEGERYPRGERKRMFCIRLLTGDVGEADDDVGVLGNKRLPNRVKWSIWFRNLLLLRRTPIVASSGPVAVGMTLFLFPGTF